MLTNLEFAMHEFHGELRPEQKVAATAMLAHETGVLAATTAFGKMVVAAWLIAQRGVSTLVLVHRRQLLDQWINERPFSRRLESHRCLEWAEKQTRETARSLWPSPQARVRSRQFAWATRRTLSLGLICQVTL